MLLSEIEEHMLKDIVIIEEYLTTCRGEKEYPRKQRLQLER